MLLFDDMIFKAGRFWRNEENGLEVERRKKEGIYPISKLNSTRMAGQSVSWKCYRGGSIFLRSRHLFYEDGERNI